jgi:hypothetical protein
VSAYEDFRKDFIDRPRRDGPDTRLLDELTPAERQHAEQQLLARVADSPAAQAGLAHLRSGAAVEPLRAVMRARRGSAAIRAAAALWKIAGDDEAFQVLRRAVERRPLWGRRPGRVDAAAVLARIERPAALAVLITALDDPDVAVRANALQAVAQRLRLNAEADALRSGHLTLPEFRAAASAALADGEQR